LSFCLATVLPRQSAFTFGVYCDFGTVKHSSLTVWATEVSNLICSPHFRSSVSIISQVSAFAVEVPTHMLSFYRYLGHSLTHTNIQENLFLLACSIYQTYTLGTSNKQPTYVLCLVHMLNTFPLCLTAAAGTEFARDFLFDISTSIWFIMLKRFYRFSGISQKEIGVTTICLPMNGGIFLSRTLRRNA